MELCVEILARALRDGYVTITFSEQSDPAKLVDSISYRALNKIRDILRDDSLNDEDCFYKIEEIICILERFGITGGNRHD